MTDTDTTDTAVAVAAPQSGSLVQRFAARFAVDADKLMTTLRSTCFKSDKPVSNEQMMALLIVAEQYHLNPFTKELFAFDDKRGGIIPYVSVDGWARIINEHPQFDGMRFGFDTATQAMTCTIYRKDRTHPTEVAEYMSECKRATVPWGQTPLRMLRHKSLIQCARLAFGFAGIHDEDEARRIRDMGTAERVDVSEFAEVGPSDAARAKVREHLARTRAKPLTFAELAEQLKRCTTTASAGAVLETAAHLPDEQIAELRELAATLDLDIARQEDDRRGDAQ